MRIVRPAWLERCNTSAETETSAGQDDFNDGSAWELGPVQSRIIMIGH